MGEINWQCGNLKQEEIQRLFTEGLLTLPDRTLCAVMLSACRVKECVTLKIRDVYDSKRRVRPELIFRKRNTKGKLATRTINNSHCEDNYRYHSKLCKIYS
ncbi:MAG: site-specific integrase [Nostoc sp.]|uniref:site-specific integrase n=1 Tax=Nostoc sp. TaxID=1180 RepID=UPI002FF09488